MTHDLAHLGETPEHLQPPSDDDTRTLVADAQASVSLAAPEAVDPKQDAQYTFDFKWTDGRGKLWDGSFTNRIQTLQDRQTIGVLRARFGASAPYVSLDPVTAEVNLMVAHMMVTLEAFPDWAKNLRQLTDLELIQEIYEEVASHEATFHGRDRSATAGNG